MEAEKLERIMARVKEIPSMKLNDFVTMEEKLGEIAVGENGAPRIKFSQLRFMTALMISKLGDEYKVTPEEVGDLPPNHPIFGEVMRKAADEGVPTGAIGG